MLFRSVWVRGLKQSGLCDYIGGFSSHPVWVRGLKPIMPRRLLPHTAVAPRVGAWIETLCSLIKKFTMIVAPRVGAWIETDDELFEVCSNRSHPVWVRGLKLRWFRGTGFVRWSHPVWVRGLKQTNLVAFAT